MVILYHRINQHVLGEAQSLSNVSFRANRKCIKAAGGGEGVVRLVQTAVTDAERKGEGSCCEFLTRRRNLTLDRRAYLERSAGGKEACAV